MINLRVVKSREALSQELSRLFDQVLYAQPARVCGAGHSWLPQMDIYETPENFLVFAEMPGVQAEDVELLVDRDHLKISGCRPYPQPPEFARVHQSEINYGNFQRVFKFPGYIYPDQASATYENGLLKIVLPKEAATRTRIKIDY